MELNRSKVLRKKNSPGNIISACLGGNRKLFSLINLIVTGFVFLRLFRLDSRSERFLDSLLYDVDIESCLVKTEFYKDGIYFNLNRLSVSEVRSLYVKTVLDDAYGIRFIKSNNPVVFDIGAHIGSFSRVIKEADSNSIVYALEPDLENFNLLQLNMSSYPDTHCIQKGVFDKKDKLTLATSNKVDWRSTFVYDESFFKHNVFEENEFSSKYEVEVTDLDSFVVDYGISKVDLMKITVSGGIEDKVLKGARNTIEKHKPVVALMTYKNNKDYVESFFKSMGYQLISVHGNIKQLAVIFLYKHES